MKTTNKLKMIKTLLSKNKATEIVNSIMNTLNVSFTDVVDVPSFDKKSAREIISGIYYTECLNEEYSFTCFRKNSEIMKLMQLIEDHLGYQPDKEYSYEYIFEKMVQSKLPLSKRWKIVKSLFHNDDAKSWILYLLKEVNINIYEVVDTTDEVYDESSDKIISRIKTVLQNGDSYLKECLESIYVEMHRRLMTK
tara:strand:- start:5040 stop:5621 length:582 start_codon:yes stop_codon:yes gene_type:complete